MWQKNYEFGTVEEAIGALPAIRQEVGEHAGCADALLHIFTTSIEKKHIVPLLQALDDALPYLKRVGCSEFSSGGGTRRQGVKLNFMLTKEAHFYVEAIPAVPGEEEAAAALLSRRINEIDNVKGVELFPVNMALDVTHFMDLATAGREELPIFGAMANMMWQSLYGIIKEDTLFVIGREIFSSGFLAVIYAGETLDVYMDYILGWQPVGRKMEIVLGEKKSFGESCVKDIDGRPAIEIYQKYFGVEWDDNFIANICEFPLMVERNGTSICMIPLAKSDHGELYFSGTLHEGEKLCFSYGTEEEVLGSALAGSERMQQFRPEAVFLSLCGNRVNYLRDDAHIEWDYYRAKFSELVFCHGHYEISYQNRRGGVLNSSFIAVGLRERNADEKAFALPDKSYSTVHRTKGIIPLPYRMSRFLHVVTKELSEMAKEADAANRAKSAFLSSMSHEIRTPINAVLGMDEMILRGTKEDETYAHALDIQTAGKSLLGLVNDILDFSKIEAGKLEIIPVEYSPAKMLYDLVNLVQKRTEDKGLLLVVEADKNIPAVLYGDEVRIKQVITNILTNAVKYTLQGTVTLHFGFRRRSDAEISLLVSVTDTGIGIKEEDIAKLFSAFERIEEKRNRNVEGTGLGMSITQELLGMMGSRLEVKSVYGEGSTFSFSLKQSVISHSGMGDWRKIQAQERTSYRARFTASRAKILVVDDTPMNLTVMKGLLKETKINVDTAESGRECIAKIKGSAYDMIFLDHRMPDMDGKETLDAIRNAPGKCAVDVPVIAMTANNVIGARDEYLSQGFSEYLLKPVDSALLEELVERFLPPERLDISNEGAEDIPNAVDEKPGETQNITNTDDVFSRLANIAGIDAESAAESMGKKELYIEVIQDFAKRAKEAAASIETYSTDGDIVNYTIKVHALKSSARIIGATKLSVMAAHLEELGDAGNLTEIRRRTGELLAIYRSLGDDLSFLAEGEAEDDEGDKGEISSEQLDDAFITLREFLVMFDYDNATEVLSMLLSYRLPQSIRKDIQKLKQYIANLEQEQAMYLLEEICRREAK